MLFLSLALRELALCNPIHGWYTTVGSGGGRLRVLKEKERDSAERSREGGRRQAAADPARAYGNFRI